jgi:hypothetical protein
MSMKLYTIVELTTTELDSVTGGQSSFQTQMAKIQMMIKMNEALAKMLKATGDAVKGLT